MQPRTYFTTIPYMIVLYCFKSNQFSIYNIVSKLYRRGLLLLYYSVVLLCVGTHAQTQRVCVCFCGFYYIVCCLWCLWFVVCVL